MISLLVSANLSLSRKQTFINKEEYTLTHREAVSTKLNLIAFNIELVSFA